MTPTIGKSTTGRAIPINVNRLIVSRLLIAATSGQGKSWTMRRLLEQTHGQIQQIVIDVEGEFFTLREKFDYVLAGGTDGDCPADVRCAAMLARKLLELRVSAIIDIYELTMRDRVQFVKLFLESMINAPKSLWHPVMVVIDEAQLFSPQDTKCDSTQAVVDLMTRGRKRGFVGVLATLRPAALDANVRATAINKLIGGMSLDIDVDRCAKDLGFFKREDRAQLQSLKPGTFFAVGPALCDKVTEIIVGPVVTSHPKPGQQAMTPPPPRENVRQVLAALADLPAEAEREVQTVQELQRKVASLQTELRTARPDAELKAMEQRHAAEMTRVRTAAKRAIEMLANVPQAIEATREYIAPIAVGAVGNAIAVSNDVERRLKANLAAWAGDKPDATRPTRGLPVATSQNGHGSIPIGERAILTACAQYPDGCTREQLSILAGYKKSSRNAYISRLATRGYVKDEGTTVLATDAGIAALGSDYEPLPTGVELQRYWLAKLPAGERAILQLLLDAQSAVDRESLTAATGYKKSTRNAYISRMAAKQIVTVSSDGTVSAARELFG